MLLSTTEGTSWEDCVKGLTQSHSGSLYGKWSSIFLLYSAFAFLMAFLRLEVESPAKVVVGCCMGSGPQSLT